MAAEIATKGNGTSSNIWEVSVEEIEGINDKKEDKRLVLGKRERNVEKTK